MTTSFAHVDYPTRHPGVERAARVGQGFATFTRAFDGARATASLLLAAWIVLWAVAFAGLALLAAPARRATQSVRAGYKAWRAEAIQRHHDEQFWQAALNDARLMADISRAMSVDAVRDIKAYY